MKPKYFYIVLFIAAASFLAFNAFTSEEGGKAAVKRNEKIIKFSHKFHAENAGVTECQTCHAKVPASKAIGDELFPTHEECKACHDTENSDECKKCHYDEVFEPIKPSRTDIMFDHSFHTGKQNLTCEKCHEGVMTVDYGSEAPQGHPAMATCNSCHSNFKGAATNQCEACHVSTVNLIPASHKTADFRKTHKFDAEKSNANCAMCHDNSSCQECHVATTMLTEKNTAADFYTPYSPSNFQTDGARKQQITKVHDLNYVYTHGIDLKGATTECQTCHQTETFCVPCHNDRKADFSLAGVTPASHRMPNFVSLGVGSGGGEHARDAKRDIESCQSCHDTQGGDPTCITCHLDSDGIKGTNPKTHAFNFMRDNHGDWHSSAGSLCYNCHVSASPNSQPGLGFCGYCHGKK